MRPACTTYFTFNVSFCNKDIRFTERNYILKLTPLSLVSVVVAVVVVVAETAIVVVIIVVLAI
jgi:ABC-type multidrug transport system permease subunit